MNIKFIAVSALLATASTASSAVLLDFNGGTATLPNGTSVSYTVTVSAGTLVGDPTTGRFTANETLNPLVTSVVTIDFGVPVDFTVSSTDVRVGNSGDNQGSNFVSNGGVFTSTGLTGATLAGDGTSNNVTFTRTNGGVTSGSEINFGSFTTTGTTQVVFSAAGGGSNIESFTFEIDAALPIPEPSSTALLGLAGLALLGRRRR